MPDAKPELDVLGETLVASGNKIRELREERDELQRQLAEARKDRERLDWLMENRTSLWNSQYKNREAIDAARIAQGQEVKK